MYVCIYYISGIGTRDPNCFICTVFIEFIRQRVGVVRKAAIYLSG